MKNPGISELRNPRAASAGKDRYGRMVKEQKARGIKNNKKRYKLSRWIRNLVDR